MSKSSNRVRLFNTTRGRRLVKHFIIGGVALLGGLLTIFMLIPSPAQVDSATAFGQDKSGPKNSVDAPLGRPFALPLDTGMKGVAVSDLNGVVPGLMDQRIEKLSGKQQNNTSTSDGIESAGEAEGYQDAVNLFEKFVVAYGTYSPAEQSAQEWVDSLPSLEKSVKTSIMQSVETDWEELALEKTSSTATFNRQSFKDVYYSQDGSELVFTGSVNKRDGLGVESTKSYMISMKRVDGSWSVTSIK